MVKELDFLQIYHLKDMFLSSEFFINCSTEQLIKNSEERNISLKRYVSFLRVFY